MVHGSGQKIIFKYIGFIFIEKLSLGSYLKAADLFVPFTLHPPSAFHSALDRF